jgi:Fur family ferric uptake transcriptional regulator
MGRIDLGEGQAVYTTHQHGVHIHLVCRQCGQVIDADQNLMGALNNQLIDRYQFTADLQHISVLGLCSDGQVK